MLLRTYCMYILNFKGYYNLIDINAILYTVLVLYGPKHAYSAHTNSRRCEFCFTHIQVIFS